MISFQHYSTVEYLGKLYINRKSNYILYSESAGLKDPVYAIYIAISSVLCLTTKKNVVTAGDYKSK